jgi:DNA-binding protein
MEEKKKQIPVFSIENLIRKYSKFRVSEDAKEELRFILEDYLREISLKAKMIAIHNKRKTIKREDIVVACD